MRPYIPAPFRQRRKELAEPPPFNLLCRVLSYLCPIFATEKTRTFAARNAGTKPNKMKDFAAIDFETANGQRSSVCSVGVVVVRNGVITDTFYSLIHPVPDYYAWFCQQVHGLSREDTESAPSFPEVWKQIAPRIAGLTLVAHNSPFDEGCLKAVFQTYQMEYPGYRFRCTCRAARRHFGKQLPNHQLHTVSKACGFNLEHHHHALADAEACAHIALKLL